MIIVWHRLGFVGLRTVDVAEAIAFLRRLGRDRSRLRSWYVDGRMGRRIKASEFLAKSGLA